MREPGPWQRGPCWRWQEPEVAGTGRRLALVEAAKALSAGEGIGGQRCRQEAGAGVSRRNLRSGTGGRWALGRVAAGVCASAEGGAGAAGGSMEWCLVSRPAARRRAASAALVAGQHLAPLRCCSSLLPTLPAAVTAYGSPPAPFPQRNRLCPLLLSPGHVTAPDSKALH